MHQLVPYAVFRVRTLTRHLPSGITALCFALLIILFTPLAHAQSTPVIPDDVLREQDRIIGREAQEQDTRDRERRTLQPPPAAPDLGPDPIPPPSAGCVNVQSVQLDGAEALSQEEQDALIAPYLSRCLTIEQIEELIAAITQAYVDRGLITSRAYLPAQDLAGGRLMILVVEGQVEAIRMTVNGKERIAPNMAFPGLIGDRLNIRDIEQGLDQINRLSTVDATIQLEPGTESGDSVLAVSATRDKQLVLSTAIDNSGSLSTGDLQGEIGVTGEDLLGFLEAWSVTYSHNLNPNWHQRRSESIRADFSIPLGYWTARWSTSWYDYRSTVVSTLRNYQIEGTSLSHRVELDRVIHRDDQGKTALTVYGSLGDTVTFIEGLKIDSSSFRIVTVGGQVNHARRMLGGVFSGSVGYEQGLNLFGAQRNPVNLTHDDPRAQFIKLNGDLSYQTSFNLGGFSPGWSVQAVGQYSPHTLYSTERITIGGQYSVRGLDESTFSGDIGGYIRNELTLPLPVTETPWLRTALGSPQLFTALDAGFLAADARDPFERGTAVGVAGGLRLRGGLLVGSVSAEKALSKPNFLEKEGLVFRARVGLQW